MFSRFPPSPSQKYLSNFWGGKSFGSLALSTGGFPQGSRSLQPITYTWPWAILLVPIRFGKSLCSLDTLVLQAPKADIWESGGFSECLEWEFGAISEENYDRGKSSACCRDILRKTFKTLPLSALKEATYPLHSLDSLPAAVHLLCTCSSPT